MRPLENKNMKARTYGLVAALCAIATAASAAPPARGITAADLSRIQYEISMWWGYWYQHGDTAAAELQQRFNSDWERHSGAEGYLQPGEDPAAFNDRIELSKAMFLCTWKRAHAAGNPTSLDFCDPTQSLSTQLDAAAVRERKHAQDLAAARRRDFAQRVGKESGRALCLAYHAHRYPEARAELQRRHALSRYEWSLIDKNEVAVGMSELALLCSLGPAKVNQTITGAGASAQYVYSENFLVYVEDGRVTAVQDTK